MSSDFNIQACSTRTTDDSADEPVEFPPTPPPNEDPRLVDFGNW